MKQPNPPETVWVTSPVFSWHEMKLGDHISWFDRRVRCSRLGTVVEVDKDRVKLEFEP